MLWTAPLSNILMARGDPISMPHFGWLLWLLVAHMRQTTSASVGPVLGAYRTFVRPPATSQFDAVDGAPSAASKCHKVVALRQATLRGAVPGRGYHDRSGYCEVGIPGAGGRWRGCRGDPQAH